MKARLRTFTLWTGTLLSVLIAAAFVVSSWWWIVVQVPTPYGPALYMVAGSAMFVADRMQSEAIDVGSSSMGLTQWNDWDAELWVYVVVPLYAVLIAVAIPTLLVWRYWPKRAKAG